ncbi:MAG: hypothetical protein HZA12_05205 [Nitrospirae bacterium]|nr:hypothetical protein [Nitrospirota bacterium]
MEIMDVFTKRNQRGASLIIIIAIILIMGIIAAVFVSLINTESFTALNQSAGEEAFAIAEGGLEFEQRSLAQNLDWYRSTSDPIATTTRTLGSGSFEVKSNLPATMLRRRLRNTELATINVYTTDRFPDAGTLQIDDDAGLGNGEFVQYTNKTTNTFTGLPLTRGVLFVGGTLGQGANTFSRGTRVYPVTTLVTALVNNCATIPNPFQISAHLKFLSAGTINVYDRTTLASEEITYTGSSTAGGVMTLTGVQRCQNGTSVATVNAGDPVTPIFVDGTSPDYEAEATSTGTVAVTITGNAVRVIRKTVQR